MKNIERSDCGCPGAIRGGAVGATRREFLSQSSCGFGIFALAGLMAERGFAEPSRSQPLPHLPARAKHVIFCFMDGGPSHVDTFDYKPALARFQGTRIGQAAVSKKAQSKGDRRWLGSPWNFNRRGESGSAIPGWRRIALVPGQECS